jgi:hypothetical protein
MDSLERWSRENPEEFPIIDSAFSIKTKEHE